MNLEQQIQQQIENLTANREKAMLTDPNTAYVSYHQFTGAISALEWVKSILEGATNAPSGTDDNA